MSKQAQVGLFTLFGIFAVLAVFVFVADIATKARGYRVGVHFSDAAGLQAGARVYLSGVPIGAVDRISLLPDYSTEVIMAIKPDFDIPAGSRFLVQAPITGDPLVLIRPPTNTTRTSATLPREVLAIGQQPRGSNPTSISDLLEQGQGEVRRLDTILAQFETSEPRLIGQLESTLKNANALTTNANRSLSIATNQVQQLTDSLQKNLTLASTNVVGLTGSLNSIVKRDSVQVDSLLVGLNSTSKSFGETVDSLREVATNPQLKGNLLQTTHDFALTAKTFAALTQDLRNVTGNVQTQAQLRDTVAQVDATSQKVDSLVGSLGGKSNVYGVDSGATPAPAPPTTTGPASGGGTRGGSQAPAQAASRVTNALGSLRDRLATFKKDLVVLQFRASELSPQRAASAKGNVSPLLTLDRGPQSDFNVLVLPHGTTGAQIGVNDIGSSGTSSANFLILNRTKTFTYGGGIEYSRAGVVASITRKALGLEARAYDLRHPTLDTYFNLFPAPKFQLFAGERDVTHASRRSVLGLQLEF
ncbi:MAG: MlaD family protein [Candidatus Eremiobacteraeota bacterium]|nr:MlaD family protein [Candidatus Eremiobacteraeota bacterium]